MSRKRPGTAKSMDALFDAVAEAEEVTRAATVLDGVSGQQMLSIRTIRPDPLQARRVLPPAVRAGFIAGQLDPPAALAAWRAMAEDDEREAELLENQVVSLATSIRQQEMVNPITVCPDDQESYIVETGERRWWAHWWLVSVLNLPVYEKIRAHVVPASSPERQAAENLQDIPLTAVQESCQIARLLLHLTGRDSDHVVAISADHEELVGYAPYRLALDLDRGDVYGKWQVIARVMGRGERQLQRQLKILDLTDDALSLADRAALTEGQLRDLASAAADTDPERQRRIVSLIARYDLPGVEVAKLIKVADLNAAEARIRRQKGLDEKESTSPVAVRRPSTIMVERLRKARQFAVRHEKGGLQVADLVEEIIASDQADIICQELDELTEMLLLLQQRLAGRLGRSK